MAEHSFREVMHEANRLCMAQNNCDNDCPLDNMGCCGNFGAHCSNPLRVERIEDIVMSWAAEHPEPVYPTWEEWLQSVGVMESSDGLLKRIKGQLLIDGIPAHAIPTIKVLEPIPADLAQKLGVKPKEGL